MRICVGSGKGGTGKTTVSLGIAISLTEAGNAVQYIDCDVEEPNAHLFFKDIVFDEITAGVLVPEIDKDKCDLCGKCSDLCAYHALAVFPKTILVFNEMCHSCGGCAKVCPKKAITEVSRVIGKIKTGSANGLKLSYGELNVGETLAPPLIRKVKKNINENDITIIDAPPGTACPFVETVRQSDFCVLVTEPTPFGLHDLGIAIDVVKILGVPYGVVINRSDVGDMSVEHFCQKNDIPILLRIPNDRNIAVAYSNGMPITAAVPEYKDVFVRMYKEIYERVGGHKR